MTRDEIPSGAVEPARMWRRLDATLVYDSRLATPVTGVRAAKPGFPRLIFQASGYEIDIQVRLSSTAGRLHVVGQVLDDDYEPCAGWVAIEGARGVVKTALDACGHFAIDGLTSGGHWLEVELPSARIALPPVYL
jgi:hypothetical protein